MKQGWEKRKLGEICEKVSRGISPKYIEKNGVIVLNQKCIRDHKINYEPSRIHDYINKNVNPEKYIRIGDVLVNSTGVGTLGRVAQVRELPSDIVTVDSHISIVRPMKGKFYLDFFGWAMVFIENEIKNSGSGASGQTELARKVLENSFTLVYPQSLHTQQRIVAILDETFAAIDKARANAEKNLKNSTELFKSYLQSVFENKGEGWEEKTLGELGKVSMCKRILKKQTSPLGDIPFYKIGTFGKTSNAFIDNDIYQEYKENYSFPKKGEILISASGTIGRRVVYDGEPAYFQDSNIVWIANSEEFVINSFLYFFYAICNWNPSKGATISRLYNGDLRKIKIPFPVDKLKQEKIVNMFEKVDADSKKLGLTYQKKIENLEELKKSVLQKAFSGELESIKEVAI